MDHVFHRVEEYINKSKFCKLMNNNSLFYKSMLRVKELYRRKI